MKRKFASICAAVLFFGIVGNVGAEEAKKDEEKPDENKEKPEDYK